MVAASPRARFDPVQVQKVLFLIDREVGDDVGGPHFAFQPSAYGPFDPDVFSVLEQLAAEGKAVIDSSGPCSAYSVAGAGRSDGQAILGRMERRVSHYIAKAARWVLSQSFWDLIAGIHRAYPEMALDSRMLLAAIPGPDVRRPRRLHPFLAGMAGAVSFPGRLGRSGAPSRVGSAALNANDWRAVGDDLRLAMERWAAAPARRP